MSDSGDTQTIITLSLSWCYALIFMFSLYVQIFNTWRWRSSSGVSFDWIQFSLYGYICMTVFTCGMYFSDNVRTEFEDNHPDIVFPVHFSDVALAINGVFMMMIIMAQHFIYRRDVSIKYSALGLIIIMVIWFTFFVMCLLAIIPGDSLQTNQFFQAVAILYCVSVFFRYPPQISLIFRLRSTNSWSMLMVYLQVIGICVLCIQVAFDTMIAGAWELFTGSAVQLLIISLILFYSFVIILQRFTCCTDENKRQSRREIIEEQVNLSQRIYYEDEARNPEMGDFKIFEDYDPTVSGRISKSQTGMVYMSGSDIESIFTDDDDLSSFGSVTL